MAGSPPAKGSTQPMAAGQGITTDHGIGAAEASPQATSSAHGVAADHRVTEAMISPQPLGSPQRIGSPQPVGSAKTIDGIHARRGLKESANLAVCLRAQVAGHVAAQQSLPHASAMSFLAVAWFDSMTCAGPMVCGGPMGCSHSMRCPATMIPWAVEAAWAAAISWPVGPSAVGVCPTEQTPHPDTPKAVFIPVQRQQMMLTDLYSMHIPLFVPDGRLYSRMLVAELDGDAHPRWSGLAERLSNGTSAAPGIGRRLGGT